MDILNHINEVKHSVNEDISVLLDVLKNLEYLVVEVEQNGIDSGKVKGLIDDVKLKAKDANICNNRFAQAVNDVVNHFMPAVSWHSDQREMLEMYYTQGNSPWEFWLTYNSSTDIDELLKIIEQRYNDGKLKKINGPSIGQYVCCYDNKTFFRGLILKVTHNNTRVRILNVDRFNEKIVKADCIYGLPLDVCEPHANTMQCCLVKDNSAERRWNRELEGLFRNVLSESRLTVRIVDKIEGLPPKFIVELYAFNESLEVETNVSHWICNRLLPLLKELDEDIKNEDIISHLSEELLDPFVCIPGIEGSGSEDNLGSNDSLPISHSRSTSKINSSQKSVISNPTFGSSSPKVTSMSPVSSDSRLSRNLSMDIIKPIDPISSTNDAPDKNRNRLAYLMASHTETKDIPSFEKILDRGRKLEGKGIPLESTLSAKEFVPLQNLKSVDHASNGSVFGEELFIKPTPLQIGNYEEDFIPGNYIPKDEVNICESFAKKNYCWKPACTKLHEKLPADKWTDESLEIYDRTLNDIDLPREGTQIVARVTNVVSPNMFYVNLPDDFSEIEEGERNETYQSMMTDLNNAGNVNQFKLLSINPCMGELIVVFSSRKKKWCRARVCDHSDINISIKVFLVDCGQYEEVFLSDCREIETQFIHLPYQAVYCTLANVYCDLSLDDVEMRRGETLLKELIMDKEILMYVVLSDPGDNRLEVIVTVGNINVNETMVHHGICNWYMI